MFIYKRIIYVASCCTIVFYFPQNCINIYSFIPKIIRELNKHLLDCLLVTYSNPSILCCDILTLMLKTKMESYTKDELTEIQEAFHLFDTIGDKRIHVTQIGDIVRALGHNPSQSDVNKFVSQHKPEERIKFEVFLPIFQTISKSRNCVTSHDIIEDLRHFDKDGNGFISSAKLRYLLTGLGEKLTDEEVEQLLLGHEDLQGNINYEEFIKKLINVS